MPEDGPVSCASCDHGWVQRFVLWTQKRDTQGYAFKSKERLSKQQYDQLCEVKLDSQYQTLYTGVERCQCQPVTVAA